MLVWLISLSTDPADIIESPVDLRLSVNQTFLAQFSCTAFGNPIPQIVWNRISDSDLSDNEGETISVTAMIDYDQYTITSLLMINSTNRSRDEGIYNCTAINNVINDISAVNIQNAQLIVQGRL